VLHLSFGALDYRLPPHDGFLFLVGPFDLLSDSNQLLLLNSFILRDFFLPVLQLNLLEVDISLDDLY
jgi:hypothetical protein